jgi:methylmalonyl-CoA mutase
MSDLNLAAEFPPVPTADWEAAIRADLKGVDYDGRLVWRTEEGLAVRPYYRAEDIAGLPPFLGRAEGHAWEIAAGVPEGPHVIRVDRLHEAGAHAAQELAWGLSAGVEMIEQGARDVQMVFAIGPYYFIEIAKFRAARLLWANVVAAFGIDVAACPLRVAAVTPLRNKSVYDRYNNLLRVTTEALSAVLGGCDSLTIQPFGFDPRLAANVQHILREEAHVDAVADPAGGSYYIESLTVALAREAWRLFQQIEAGEGIERAVAETRAAREKAVASRRHVLVGVNSFPNLTEKTPEFAPPASQGYERLAEPFERIRARTAEMAQEMGRYPKVLLLTRGDLKMLRRI